MDTEALLLLMCIAILFACLIASVFYLLHYTGLLGTVKITVGKPAINNIWIAYKHHIGPYKNCGPHFTEAYTLCPELKCIAVYYDDPKVVPASELRYIVGLVLCEGEEKPSQNLVTRVTNRDFQIYELPAIDYAVKTSFPFIFSSCAWIATWRVYPALTAFIEQQRLSAHPFIEVYFDDLIHYMAPLSKQSDFFVPEVNYSIKQSPKASHKFEQSDVANESYQADTSDEESQGTASSFEEVSAD